MELSMFIRWSQLALALIIMAIEFISRRILGTFFSLISLKYFWGSSKYAEEEFFEENENSDLEHDTKEMIVMRGYPCEEHFALTADGFILGLQRIPLGKKNIDNIDGANYMSDGEAYSAPLVESVTHNTRRTPRTPVLIIHGFLQSSETWVCRKNAQNSLPLVLADEGYDVWLGNNRGNKYSCKHMHYSSHDEQYWNFSLDELILYDLPAMINYVLSRNGSSSLVLIGFSQGTAQSWAALSSNPSLHGKVRLFVALAPVATVKGFSNPLVDAIARSRPDFITLLFGKRAFLPSTMFWRRVLPREFYVNLLDFIIAFLFGWKGECLDQKEKKLLYSHIYSFSSVKAVVHWFQIIYSGKFQMFDETLMTSRSPLVHYKFHSTPQYQPSLINTPVAIFYGESDTLPNTNSLLNILPKNLVLEVHKIPNYEHLDFMWSVDCGTKIYPKILKIMDNFKNKSE